MDESDLDDLLRRQRRELPSAPPGLSDSTCARIAGFVREARLIRIVALAGALLCLTVAIAVSVSEARRQVSEKPPALRLFSPSLGPFDLS